MKTRADPEVQAAPAPAAQPVDRRTGTVWMGVVSAALLLVDAPFAAEALSNPESPAVVPLSMLTVAGVLAVAASRRRDTADIGSRLLRFVAALALIAVVAAGGALAAQRWSSQAVEMHGFAFAPNQVVSRAGRVELELVNRDTVRHTFTVDALGVDFSVAAGGSRRVTFEAPEGSYRLYCIPHDPRMEGRLIVR